MDMIRRYEEAVLEWFNKACPNLREMIYAEDINALLGLQRTQLYPSLIYSRDAIDWVLPKALTVSDTCNGVSLDATLYHTAQEYTAHIIMESQVDLLGLANSIRHYWGSHSYAYVRFPDEDHVLPVAMRLYNFKLSSVRNNLDTKGALRDLTIVWRSDLVLYNALPGPRYTGYRLILRPNGIVQQDLDVTAGVLPGSGSEVSVNGSESIKGSLSSGVTGDSARVTLKVSS